MTEEFEAWFNETFKHHIAHDEMFGIQPCFTKSDLEFAWCEAKAHSADLDLHS